MEVNINKSFNKYSKYKNIIIICAGDNSLHKKKKWFSKSREYILCINYFGDNTNIHKDYKKIVIFLLHQKALNGLSLEIFY